MRQEEIQEREAPPEAKGKKVSRREGGTNYVKYVKRVRTHQVGFGNMADTGNLENQAKNMAAKGPPTCYLGIISKTKQEKL